MWYQENKIKYVNINENERKKTHVTLDKVTSIQCLKIYSEHIKECLINALPNLNHLVLSSIDLPSIENELT